MPSVDNNDVTLHGNSDKTCSRLSLTTQTLCYTCDFILDKGMLTRVIDCLLSNYLVDVNLLLIGRPTIKSVSFC